MSNRVAIRVVLLSAVVLGAACGGDDPGTVGAQPDESTTTVSGVTIADINTTFPLDIPTTFIENCSQMPAPAAMSAIVGIPLDDGTVVAAGTCDFRGLNEQNRVIRLALLQQPIDIANFNDLQLSLGPSTPLNDPLLADVFVDPSHLVYVSAHGWIYSVRTQITDAPPAEQMPTSAAVLRLWFGV